MSQRSSFAAITEIKSWSVDDVLAVLNKNGLESTSAVFKRREIDGEDLLNLTEGKLALWKRDLSLADIRKLSSFMNELNTYPERFLLIENGRQNGAAKPHKRGWPASTSCPPLPPLPPRPRSPASDTGSWDTDFEDDHDPSDDVYSEPPDDGQPQPPLKPNAGFLYSKSSAAPLPRDKPTPGRNLYTRAPSLAAAAQHNTGDAAPVKPPIPSRPPVIPAATKPWSNGAAPHHHPQGNTSALFGLPQPPTPHLENLISHLNLREFNGQDEYFEEDEYTSIEEGVGCNPQSLGFPPRGGALPSEPPLALPPRKITPAEQPPMSHPPRKLTPAELPPMTLSPRAITPTEPPSHESSRAASPTPYPKLSFRASQSRSPASLPAIPPVKQEEPHFNNIPAGIPNQMSALSNKNAHAHALKPPMPLPVYNPGSSQSLDKLWGSNEYLNATPSEGDRYEPEEYETIDNPAHRSDPSQAAADYYLQPLSAPLPLRGVVAAPEIVAPSSRPPSPPRKKSFPDDVSCADGSGGKLSDKLRTLMKLRQTSTSSTDEPPREKSPMPELQKPPPVERPGPGPRPLPPTPDAPRKPGQEKMNPRRNSRVFTQMPWYHNVDRKRAEEMLKNGEDGKFLLRPSMQTQNPLTLTLWYNKRLYNISVRQRTDQRYALGTEKPNEQSFSSVEELVQHYQGEELVLYSGGERTGKTLLTSSPPRQSS